ncbi:MAG: hypothetical protein HOP23_11350 [Methylococcaceae bacterium]|nr:hypothetical protein [Methylococcaceae bacterium]
MSYLQSLYVWFDRALLSEAEGLVTNGKTVNKFNTTSVRPEPVEGKLPGVLQVPHMIIT